MNKGVLHTDDGSKANVEYDLRWHRDNGGGMSITGTLRPPLFPEEKILTLETEEGKKYRIVCTIIKASYAEFSASEVNSGQQ